MDFLLINPFTVILMLMYAGCVLTRKELRSGIIKYMFLCFLVIYFSLNLLAHTKDVRYLMSLEVIIDLFAVLMLIEIIEPGQDIKRQVLFLLIIIAIVGYSEASAFDIFLNPHRLDPISYFLLTARHIIPPLLSNKI
jgi:hypothetical protein